MPWLSKPRLRGDRGLKAINNQMLSERHRRKRMQLYEQGPGSRQTPVCSRSLWGPAWKRGIRRRGVANLAGGLFFFAFLSLQAGSKPRRRHCRPPPSLCRGHLVPFYTQSRFFAATITVVTCSRWCCHIRVFFLSQIFDLKRVVCCLKPPVGALTGGFLL